MQGKVGREIVLQRQQEVADLYFVKGYTIHYISKTLKWSPKTIWNDIEAERDRFAKQISIIDVRAVYHKIWKSRVKIIRELWFMYEISEKPSDAIRALQAIDDLEQRNITDMQDLGFIVKPVERKQVESFNYEIGWKPIDEKRFDEYAKVIRKRKKDTNPDSIHSRAKTINSP